MKSLRDWFRRTGRPPKEPQNRDDWRRISEMLMSFAQDCVRSDGFLLPVGAGVRLDGQIFKFMSMEQPNDETDVQKWFDDLMWAMRKTAAEGKVRAVGYAIVCTKALEGGGVAEAIVLFLEALDGSADSIVLPYRTVDGVVVFGESYSQPAELDVFLRQG